MKTTHAAAMITNVSVGAGNAILLLYYYNLTIMLSQYDH
jgi:hypothetical protein